MNQHNSAQGGTRVPLRAAEVMKITGHKSRSAFWQFCHAAGVPHIRLNSRNVIFDRDQLDAWLESRTVGKGAA